MVSHSSFQCFKLELLTQLYSYWHNKMLFLSNTMESVMITIMKQISNIWKYIIYMFLLSRTSFWVELSRIKSVFTSFFLFIVLKWFKENMLAIFFLVNYATINFHAAFWSIIFLIRVADYKQKLNFDWPYDVSFCEAEALCCMTFMMKHFVLWVKYVAWFLRRVLY